MLALLGRRHDQLVVYTQRRRRTSSAPGLRTIWASSSARSASSRPMSAAGSATNACCSLRSCCIAWLALTRRHPVRWTEDRREHLIAGANAREHHYLVTAYADGAAASSRSMPRSPSMSAPIRCGRSPPPRGRAGAAAICPAPMSCRLSLQDLFGRDQQAAFRPLSRRGAARRRLRDGADARRGGARRWPRARGGATARTSCRPRPCPSTSHRQAFRQRRLPAEPTHGREPIGLPAIRARQKAGETDGRLIGVGFSTYTETTALAPRSSPSWGMPFAPGLRAGHRAHDARRWARDPGRHPVTRPGHRDHFVSGCIRCPWHRSGAHKGRTRRHRADTVLDRHI